jgi:uncharacterized membrane protein
VLRIEYVYWLCGLLLAACAVHDLRAGRHASAAFWGLLSVVFLAGDAVDLAAKQGNLLPAQGVGIAVIVLALIAGSGALRRRPESVDVSAEQRRQESAARLGHRLFAPALIIPFGTLALTLLQPYSPWASMDRAQATLIALGLACIAATIAALWLTRSHINQAVVETARLLDALSWAALLPMLLAILGAGVGPNPVGEPIAPNL